MLQNLSHHLLEHTGLSREQIYATADNGRIMISGKDLGHGQEICRFKYDAVITLERYAGDARVVTALIASWLMEHDHDRDYLGLADPEVNADLNDDQTADVDITVEFNESIQLVEDDKGPIAIGDTRWSVQDAPIDVAEQLVNMEGGSGEAE